MRESETLTPFDQKMQDATGLLGDGDFAGSAILFNEALGLASTPNEQVMARQMEGVALSRDGKFEEAKSRLNAAIKMAMHIHDYPLELRVRRDLAMAYVDAAQRWRYLLRRDELLRDADAMLRRCHEGLQILGLHEEAWVTAGFMGRVELVAGSRFNAEKALRDADKELRKTLTPNYDYILDNMMWLVRAVPRKERLAMKADILNLIGKTGQDRRYDELRLIMLGGDGLYRFVRALPKWAIRLGKRMFGS